MEYVQLTLDDWLEMKQKLKMELQGVKQSFVRIGYALRQMDDQKLYERDGYKSIAEFAKAEYGLEPSTTSRFMSINREYSVDGYSEQLKIEYMDMSRSQLEEMLKLPEEDRRMIRPETPRDDIRELKKFNKATPEEGVADDIHELIKQFFDVDEETLKELYSQEAFLTGNVEKISQLVDIVNPSGTRTFKKGIYFLMMYEQNIKIKKFMGTPETMEWSRFFEITKEIFGEQLMEPEPPELVEEHPKEIKTGPLEPVRNEPQKQQESESVQTKAIEPEEEKNEDDSHMGTANTVSDESGREAGSQERETVVQQIAPAQMEEQHEKNHSQTGQKRDENEGKKEKPREKTRAEYMRALSVVSLARYISEQYTAGTFEEWKDAANLFANVNVWLMAKVNREGRTTNE